MLLDGHTTIESLLCKVHKILVVQTSTTTVAREELVTSFHCHLMKFPAICKKNGIKTIKSLLHVLIQFSDINN